MKYPIVPMVILWFLCGVSLGAPKPASTAPGPEIRLILHGADRQAAWSVAYYEYFVSFSELDIVRRFQPVRESGALVFRLPAVRHTAYFCLVADAMKAGEKEVLSFYLLDPTDRVTVEWKNGAAFFSGRGADKYRCRHALDQLPHSDRNYLLYNDLSPQGYDSCYHWLERDRFREDSQMAVRESLIENFRPALADPIKARLLADVRGERWLDFFRDVRIQFARVRDTTKSISDKAYVDFFGDHYRKMKLDTSNAVVVAESRFYPLAFAVKGKSDLAFDVNPILQPTSDYSLPGLCHLLAAQYSGPLLERMLCDLVAETFNFRDSAEESLAFALGFIKQPFWRQTLLNIQAARAKGAPAWDFRMQDSAGRWVQSTDWRGKVVVLHFWYTGCGACRILASGLRECQKKMQDSPVVFVSVSIDRDREKWMRTLREGDHTGPYEINLFTEGEGSYHPLLRHYQVPNTFPQLLILDRYGRVFSNHPDWPWGGDKEILRFCTLLTDASKE